MGGRGSGRPPKNQDGLEPETTILGEGEQPDEKVKVNPKGKTTGRKFTVSEIREKIDLLFSGVAALAGREYTYQDGDFDAEAHGVVRMAEKYPVIYYALTLIDPVLVGLGLFKKFSRLGKKPKEQTEKSQEPPAGKVFPMAGAR